MKTTFIMIKLQENVQSDLKCISLNKHTHKCKHATSPSKYGTFISSLYVMIIYLGNRRRKIFQIHLLSVLKLMHALGDQIAIYMLQHFDIHVAKLVRIAERKKY